MMHRSDKAGRAIVICFWLALVCFLLAHKDEITVEKIVSFTPDNTLLAILVMLALFAVKGCTVLMNGNILYIACGVMFPLPLSIAVNMLGTFIMTTIPFWIGRKGGADLLKKLTQKYKKLEILYSFPNNNQFLLTLMLRTFGIFPCEIVGMYLGACQLYYINYISGTLLGLTPATIAYAIIGQFASAPSSPQFIAAAAFKIITTLCALMAGGIWKRKGKQIKERNAV